MVTHDSRVRVGSQVRIKDGPREDDWTIVPAEDADPGRGLISEDSPMAKALLGHRAGDRVDVPRPADRWAVIVVRCHG